MFIDLFIKVYVASTLALLILSYFLPVPKYRIFLTFLAVFTGVLNLIVTIFYLFGIGTLFFSFFAVGTYVCLRYAKNTYKDTSEPES